MKKKIRVNSIVAISIGSSFTLGVQRMIQLITDDGQEIENAYEIDDYYLLRPPSVDAVSEFTLQIYTVFMSL